MKYGSLFLDRSLFDGYVRHKFAAVSDLMNDTKLIFRLWKYSIYSIAKSRQIVYDIIFRMEAGYENVRNTAAFQV